MPDSTENYLGYLLARCSYEVSARFHQKLKSEGVHVITWRVLASIRNQPYTVNEIARRVLVNQSTLSKALDRMELDELIERQPLPDFRSKINVTITDKGETLINRLINMANEYEDRSFEHMSETEIQQLRFLLRRLIDV
jgi:DNA-binding MarR family transcriptional regulator